jgi:DNA-binding MarR family transcriptional regulator
VDQVIEQWHRERPDVEVSGMAIVGRIVRLERLIRTRLDDVFRKHDLEFWEFDVLATLRRAGPPYQLSAGELLSSMMIASGTMTNRLDRLERRGLIRRAKDLSDGRVVLATLTKQGLRKIDAALVDHAANELELTKVLDATDRKNLSEILRRFNIGLEGREAPSANRKGKPSRGS